MINSKDELSGSWTFEQPEKTYQLLEAGGIAFTANDLVDLKRYGRDLSRDLTEEELQHILNNATGMSINVSERLCTAWAMLRLRYYEPYCRIPTFEGFRKRQDNSPSCVCCSISAILQREIARVGVRPAIPSSLSLYPHPIFNEGVLLYDG